MGEHINGLPDQDVGENVRLKKVNKYLMTNTTKGLSLLRKFLPECSDATFSENCVKWMQSCCLIDEQDVASTLSNLSVMRELIVRSSKFPELVKPISSSFVTRFVDVFVKKLTHFDGAWYGLEELMWYYNGPFISHKEQLNKLFEEKYLSGKCKMSSIHAQCYALLPSSGGGGQKGSIHSANWEAQFNALSNANHCLLNRLFKDVTELEDRHEENVLSIPEDISVDDLVSRFSNTCFIMKAMLVGRYPAIKSFLPLNVIHLSSRGLSVTGGGLTSTSVLKKVLPQIHTSLLSLLSALIICCGRSLLPMATSLVRLLRQAAQSQATDVRLAAYSCLSNWLTVSGSGGCSETVAKYMIPCLLNDIVQESTGVVLGGNKANMKNTRSKLASCDDSEDIRFAALETLRLYVKSVGFLLPVSNQKELQTVVVKTLLNIQKGQKTSPSTYGSSSRCLNALYMVLVQLCLSPNPKWAPPVQYALYILKEGQQNCNPLISNTCAQGLAMLSLMQYPEYPVASFPAYHVNEADKAQETWPPASTSLLEPTAMQDDSDSVVNHNDTTTAMVIEENESVGDVSYDPAQHSVEIEEINESEVNLIDNRKEIEEVRKSDDDTMNNDPEGIEPSTVIETGAETVDENEIIVSDEISPNDENLEFSQTLMTDEVEISDGSEEVELSETSTNQTPQGTKPSSPKVQKDETSPSIAKKYQLRSQTRDEECQVIGSVGMDKKTSKLISPLTKAKNVGGDEQIQLKGSSSAHPVDSQDSDCEIVMVDSPSSQQSDSSKRTSPKLRRTSTQSSTPSKKYLLRSQTPKLEQCPETDLPMSLRSGTLLSSQSRSSSVSSGRGRPCETIGSDDEDIISSFNDSLGMQ